MRLTATECSPQGSLKRERAAGSPFPGDRPSISSGDRQKGLTRRSEHGTIKIPKEGEGGRNRIPCAAVLFHSILLVSLLRTAFTLRTCNPPPVSLHSTGLFCRTPLDNVVNNVKKPRKLPGF